MRCLTIKKYPEAVLRKRCKALSGVSATEKKLLSDMESTMHEMSGIGLAAPQVGVLKRVAIIDTGESIIKMINPKILSKKGIATLEEGCLSVPNKSVNIKRADEIIVSYIDENDKLCKKKFQGLVARIIQHEVDHLNGKLIIDYLPWLRRVIACR